MTEQLAGEATRKRIARSLFDRLKDPSRDDHVSIAALLPIIAARDDVPILESLVTDRERQPWVRRYAMRAFQARGLEPSPAAVEHVSAFAGSDFEFREALLFCESYTTETHALIDRLSQTTARKLVIQDRRFAPPLPNETRRLLYDRIVHALDDDIIYATLDYEESRDALRSRAVDLGRLGHAMQDDEVADAIIASDPSVRHALLASLTGRRVLLRCADEATLESRVRKALRGGVNVPSALAVLHQLKRAPVICDQLIGEEIETHIKLSLSGLRTHFAPGPYDALLFGGVFAAFGGSPGSGRRPLSFLLWALEKDALFPRAFRALAEGEIAEGHPAPRLSDAHVSRAMEADPFLRTLALRVRARHGDAAAIASLTDQLQSADLVELRAEALRALRKEDHLDSELALDHLARDREKAGLFYAPVISEAAAALVPGSNVSADRALDALVAASLEVDCDDAVLGIRRSIHTWFHGSAADCGNPWFDRRLNA